jgi:hypothetical protein
VRHGERLPYAYRVTKYDSTLRDERGAFTGDDWAAISDIGETFGGTRLSLAEYLAVEARHLVAVASFVEESGVSSLIAQGVENAGVDFPLREGMRLSALEAVDVVRLLLRERGWCRLDEPDRFYVHVGWDYYVYIGSHQACERSVGLARELGLYVDLDFPSPYWPSDEPE